MTETVQIDFSKIQVKKLCYRTDISKIDCTDEKGKDAQGIQEFLNEHVMKHQRSNLGTTYVVFYEKKLVGFITVAASMIHKGSVNQIKRPDTRVTPVYPAVIIAYFGVHKPYQDKGFGQFIVQWSIGLARTVSKKIGIRYMVLFAREALDYYKEKFHFQVAQITQESCPHCGKDISKKSSFKLMYADIFPELKTKETQNS